MHVSTHNTCMWIQWKWRRKQATTNRKMKIHWETIEEGTRVDSERARKRVDIDGKDGWGGAKQLRGSAIT